MAALFQQSSHEKDARLAQLERANAELEAFARQLAHELRTPIGQVVAIAKLLLGRGADRLDADQRDWLTMQLRAASQMKDTVQALQDLAWSSRGSPRMQEIDLSAVCESLRQEMADGPRRASVDWRIQAGMVVHGAPAQIDIVMRNLIGNAVKYTRDVEHPVVSVSANVALDGATRIVVADNGVGFESAQADRVFEPFVRLHSAEHFQGSGIGLSIVKRVVECHGGWIRAAGDVGGGARFEFALGGGPQAPASAFNAPAPSRSIESTPN